MTEKDLINLAARSIGIDDEQWNPLASNNDAFHLLVTLELRLNREHNVCDIVEVYGAGDSDDVISQICSTVAVGADPLKATRKAIVHTAAKIQEYRDANQNNS